MPSGGRGCAPPKSAQRVVSHYRIDYNKQRQHGHADSLQGKRCPLTPDGKPKSSASGKPFKITPCGFVCPH
jgi:hypothetical protein